MIQSNATLGNPSNPKQSRSGQSKKASLALAATLCSVAAFPATPTPSDGAGQLTVEAVGFIDDSGHAIAKLFLPGQNVRQRGHLETKAEIVNGKATLWFHEIAPGSYAIVVFHDANDNGQIDHNLLGIPKEQLGFSSGFKLSLTSGLPTFDKLRFEHGGMDQTITITVEAL